MTGHCSQFATWLRSTEETAHLSNNTIIKEISRQVGSGSTIHVWLGWLKAPIAPCASSPRLSLFLFSRPGLIFDQGLHFPQGRSALSSTRYTSDLTLFSLIQIVVILPSCKPDFQHCRWQTPSYIIVSGGVFCRQHPSFRPPPLEAPSTFPKDQKNHDSGGPSYTQTQWLV